MDSWSVPTLTETRRIEDQYLLGKDKGKSNATSSSQREICDNISSSDQSKNNLDAGDTFVSNRNPAFDMSSNEKDNSLTDAESTNPLSELDPSSNSRKELSNSPLKTGENSLNPETVLTNDTLKGGLDVENVNAADTLVIKDNKSIARYHLLITCLFECTVALVIILCFI
jgi:hypothetical protein